ncbi:hypothetical protein SLS62_008734 [Diatrype stigma]|uniref:Uncharacterized protein n=1 Tax=Diatrype stigma TaxID=117547 RepID=A0AAN9UR34_9PEZI
MAEEEYCGRRLMDWNERVSEYWVQRPEAQAALARDAEVLRGAEENGCSVEEHLGEGKTVERDMMIYRRCIEAQRIARMGREFYGFLHLPPEVRMLIYEHLLGVGDVFVPNSEEARLKLNVMNRHAVVPLKSSQLYKACGERYYRYRHYNNSIVTKEAQGRYTPGLIQAVCKRIQHEASQVFWARNRFIFSYGRPKFPLGFSGELGLGWMADYMKLARDLSYTFDSREGSRRPGSDYSGPVLDLREVRKNINFLGHGPAVERERGEGIHLDLDMWVRPQWEEIALRLRAKTRLRRLQLDFEECYCPVGCCRNVEYACSYLRGDWELAMPELVEIVGWLDEREKKQIRQWLIPLDNRENVEIRFVGQSIETWNMFNDPDDSP